MSFLSIPLGESSYRPDPVHPGVPPRHVEGAFLKGPIPLAWLSRAAALPGKTLHVGLALWYLAGLKGSMSVKLGSGALATLGVARDAKYDALERLRLSGLISLRQEPGQAPCVTLLLESMV